MLSFEFLSSSGSVQELQICFFCVILFYLLCLPFLSSRKSWTDPISAQKVISLLRFFLFIQFSLNSFLLYCSIFIGAPLFSPYQYTQYGDTGSSWIYGFGRPLCGLIFISFGGIADMHPGPRYICLCACSVQILFDAFSAFQVDDYMFQIKNNEAPYSDKYNGDRMQAYYYRDLASFTCSCVLLMLCLHSIIILGFANPPFIRYQQVDGQDLDRVRVMQDEAWKHIDKNIMKHELKPKPRVAPSLINGANATATRQLLPIGSEEEEP